MVVEPEYTFDDYLGLADIDLRDTRLVVCYGMSGSGKTTAIQFLCRENPHLRPRRAHPVRLDGWIYSVPGLDHVLIILEEVWLISHLLLVLRLLLGGNTLLVASHLHPLWFFPLRLIWSQRVFVMDRDTEKIARHLESRGIVFTHPAVQLYCRKFGANYRDVDIIMECCPEASFDQSLVRFLKFCRLKRIRDRRTESVEGLDSSAS